ncbi:fructose-bisphosphate aldolase [Vagococcus penaei]|uniref:Fructose-bisphosphate aldolase n=1 Tax=Vagococcus penaei TaxID=633807 RepID=A0A1Q2D4G8_9ENTE|nr:class II fructose-bisphosphate aldolase [Vagococcus penaei]AQP53278.1 fructose-bisphosphate aldolase [Vagococcus penaei]RSU04046.1 fructose-bisphosphate aldolase [Vagococcus penaei]
MVLVNSKELFKKAREEQYAIPACNFFDLDSARSYVAVAERENKPLILALAEAHLDMISLEEGALIGKYLAEKATVPVVLHLDHGQTLSVIERAIDLDFTSVMIDKSESTFAENVALTKKVVAMAKGKNVAVEAEIGHVGSGVNYENHEVKDSIYTEVSDAVTFVEETQVDSLAISIGTAHGAYKGEPKINFDRLIDIAKQVDIPLVLHGGSSSGDENLKRCAVTGIEKINIFTDFINSAFEAITSEQPTDYLQVKAVANQAIEKTLSHYYQVFETKEV